MSHKKMKCAHCGEDLIQEETEDHEHMDRTQNLFGKTVCYECYLDLIPGATNEVSGKRD